jgi:hypothetical protein
MATDIVALDTDEWVQLVDSSSLFYLTHLSGPAPYVAATTLPSPPTIRTGHVSSKRLHNEISRNELGNGVVWARNPNPYITTKISLTQGVGQLKYEAYQVDDTSGAFEDFQVSDGVGGHENYEVIQ